MRIKPNKHAALFLSLAALLIWGMLGTGASLAWFTDASSKVHNSFVVGVLDVAVEFRNEEMLRYEPVTQNKAVFADGALYEPGYTQVVYFQIKNEGDVPFRYRLSMDAVGWTDSMNVFGRTFHLPDHLRFGVVFGDSEMMVSRQLAQENATEALATLTSNTYSQFDTVTLQPGQIRYAALVVYMPESVGNEANFRGGQPDVTLGITLFAQQEDMP